MSESPNSVEASLALERNQHLQRSFHYKRLVSAFLSAVLSLSGITAMSWRAPMIGFCLIVAAAMFLVRYLDATGNLREIRGRSTKRLVPDLSLLKRNKSGDSQTGQSMPHA